MAKGFERWMNGCVYLLRFPNGKKYVGITRTLRVDLRLKGHKRNHNSVVGRAVRKYWEEIEFCILAKSKELLKLQSMEKLYIQSWNSLIPNGYNVSLGGDGAFGVKRTEEQKRIIGENSRLRWQNPAYREKLISNLKISQAVSNKEKQKEAARANWRNPEYREMMRKAQSLGAKRKLAAYSKDHYEKFKDELGLP